MDKDVVGASETAIAIAFMRSRKLDRMQHSIAWSRIEISRMTECFVSALFAKNLPGFACSRCKHRALSTSGLWRNVSLGLCARRSAPPAAVFTAVMVVMVADRETHERRAVVMVVMVMMAMAKVVVKVVVMVMIVMMVTALYPSCGRLDLFCHFAPQPTAALTHMSYTAASSSVVRGGPPGPSSLVDEPLARTVPCFHAPLCTLLFEDGDQELRHRDDCANAIVQCVPCGAVMRQIAYAGHHCPAPRVLTTRFVSDVRGFAMGGEAVRYGDVLDLFQALPYRVQIVPPGWEGDQDAEDMFLEMDMSMPSSTEPPAGPEAPRYMSCSSVGSSSTHDSMPPMTDGSGPPTPWWAERSSSESEDDAEAAFVQRYRRDAEAASVSTEAPSSPRIGESSSESEDDEESSSESEDDAEAAFVQHYRCDAEAASSMQRWASPCSGEPQSRMCRYCEEIDSSWTASDQQAIDAQMAAELSHIWKILQEHVSVCSGDIGESDDEFALGCYVRGRSTLPFCAAYGHRCSYDAASDLCA